MSCLQVFTARVTLASGINTEYMGPTLHNHGWDPSSSRIDTAWQVAGVWKNLKIELTSAPGSGNSYEFTLMVNNVASALTVTISDTATVGTNTTDEVTVAEGDLLVWRSIPTSTPTSSAMRISVEFHGTNPGESGYSQTDALVHTTNTTRWGPFTNVNGTGSHPLDISSELVAAAGTLNDVSIRLITAPGGATSVEFSLWKNRVKQDGSGGTPDTRITISGSGTSGSWSGSLSLAGGDTVCLVSVPSGSPTGSNGSVGVKFTATTDGESQFCGTQVGNVGTGTRYAAVQGGTPWDATENDREIFGGAVSDFVLRDFRAKMVNSATGADETTNNNMVFTLRENGAATSQTATMASGTGTASDLTNEVTISTADEFCWQYVLAATAGINKTVLVSNVMFALASPPPITSFVIGVDTTVAGVTRAFAVGLDGNTNVLDEEGKMKVFGNFEVTEYVQFQPMTAPGAPTTGCRMYLDAADGDLKVIHANGNLDVISAN